MPGPLNTDEQLEVDNALSHYSTSTRTKWCRDVLGYLGQFKWAGTNPDFAKDDTENLAMNCWCAPIYIAHKTGRLSKESVENFKLMVFQYGELSQLHASQRAAYEYLKGAGAGKDEGVPGDLIFFFIESLLGVSGTNIPQSQQEYNAKVPLSKCPVHVAVNMGPGKCVSLWSTPNDYDKYQYVAIKDLVSAIERDRKTNCNYTSIEPFWLTGAKSRKPCYVTTATCRSRGLPDDCRELTALRWFRDTVVALTPDGRRAIAAYYETAPRIVAAIDRRPDAAAIYDEVYREYLVPAVAAIEVGRYPAAESRLRELVDELQACYAPDGRPVD